MVMVLESGGSETGVWGAIACGSVAVTLGLKDGEEEVEWVDCMIIL